MIYMNKKQLTDAEQQELLLRMKKNYTYDAATGRLTSSRLGRALKGKKCSKNGYLCVGCRIDKRLVFVYLHHAVWAVCKGRFPERQIDHVNGNKQDNRIENLREVDPSENNLNVLDGCAGRKSMCRIVSDDSLWKKTLFPRPLRGVLSCDDVREEIQGTLNIKD